MWLVHLATLGPNISWIGEVCYTLDTTSLTSLVDNHWPAAGIWVNLSFLKAQSIVSARGDYNIAKYTCRWLWRWWPFIVGKSMVYKHCCKVLQSFFSWEGHLFWSVQMVFLILSVLYLLHGGSKTSWMELQHNAPFLCPKSYRLDFAQFC